MKVSEIAKKFNVTSKEILAFLKEKKIAVKSYASKLDKDAISLLERSFVKGKQTAEQQPAKKKTERKKKTGTKAEASKATKRKKTAAPQGGVSKKRSKPIKKKEHAPRVKPSLETRRQAVQETPLKPSVGEKPRPKEVLKRSHVIRVKIPITVSGLSTNLMVKTSALIKTLMGMGIFATVNQLLDEEIIMKVAEKFGALVEKIPSEEEKLIQEHEKDDDAKNLEIRSPVVTMMGHVDHGKTSLLDTILKSNMVDREAGKITQHIGAYKVTIADKGTVTFLDTPGHAAFTAMRARGAHLTDIVVLVIAADDGVMPQTVEAIDHARAAGTPIVVAINKVDLPAANPDKVRAGLQKHDLVSEEWGGKTIMVRVSAKTGKGVDELLEMLLLEAEILELKANTHRLGQGTVIEGKLSKSLGSVANVLVQNGTLHVGDIVVSGRYYGKIRAMHNDQGKKVKEAGPSTPVEILGLSGVPESGERVYVVRDERQARSITERRLLEHKERSLSGTVRRMSLEGLYDKIKEATIKELKIILKADVRGSVEVLKQSLEKLSTDKIKLKVIHSSVGGINESDVVLATASDAIIIGFHVKADSKAHTIIEKEKVDVKYYRVIYEAINDVKLAMEGLLEPTVREHITGRAEMMQIFKASKIGNIGGSIVRKGKLVRNQLVRLIRDNIVVCEGKFHSLRRFKDDVKEVAEGYECGVVLENYSDIKVGDIIECYREEKIASKL